jgi:glutathione S-transferase
MPAALTLVSHHLCPYVQRVAIVLTEKGVPFDRVYVDLGDKPEWFNAISPLGKVPLLKADDQVIFESAVILEYLEETQPDPLHPADPLARARHRAWIEFASSTLDGIGALYNAPDAVAFAAKADALAAKFNWIESELGRGPWFAGARFSLVDAAFGPVFRYFDVFDGIADFGVLADKPKLATWRAALSNRPSIRSAVVADYPDRLISFLRARRAYLSSRIAETTSAAA